MLNVSSRFKVAVIIAYLVFHQIKENLNYSCGFLHYAYLSLSLANYRTVSITQRETDVIVAPLVTMVMHVTVALTTVRSALAPSPTSAGNSKYWLHV